MVKSKHFYSSVVLLILIFSFIAVFLVSAISSADLDQICDLDGNTLYRSAGEWGCYAEYLKSDGSIPLTNDWNVGTYSIYNIGALIPSGNGDGNLGASTNFFNNLYALTYENSTGGQFLFDRVCTSDNGLCATGTPTANLTNVAYLNNTQTFTKENKFNDNMTINNILKMNESLGRIRLGIEDYLTGITSDNTKLIFNGTNEEWYIYGRSETDNVLNTGLHLGSSQSSPIIIDEELVLTSNSSVPRNAYFGWGGNPSAVSRPIPPDFQIDTIASGTSNKQNVTLRANRATGLGTTRGIKELAINLNNSDNPFFRIHMGSLIDTLVIDSNGKSTFKGFINNTNANGIQSQSYSSADGSVGMTNTTGYWMCKDNLCLTTCQAIIKNGLLISC